MLPIRPRRVISALAVAAIFAGPAVLTAPMQAAAETPAKKKAANSAKAKAEARIKARAAAKKRRAAAAKKRRAAKAKARKAAKDKKAAMARRKMAKPDSAKKKMSKMKPDASGEKHTQTALSVQPSSKLIKLVRSIQEEMKAGEDDGSLTKGEIARLASLKERVEIMDRMSRNDKTFRPGSSGIWKPPIRSCRRSSSAAGSTA